MNVVVVALAVAENGVGVEDRNAAIGREPLILWVSER